MANIQERRDKNGKLISYSIRVHRGRGADGKQLKPWITTFEVSPTWSEKSARKKAEAFAATFEAQCKAGIASDSRLKFSEYCDYVIDLKEKRGAKHSTIASYRDLVKRIYPHIGHLKLKDLRADHLNSLYTELSKTTFKSTAAKSKVDLPAILKEQHTTRAAISKSTGLAECTVSAAVRGDSVSIKTAMAVSDALGLKYEKTFLVLNENRALSAKTVTEHHRLISTVLKQAVKEGLVPFNVAAKADPPKVEKKDVNYFQPKELAAIRDALEEEPLKWKVLTHLLLITGARRGEVLGLKWSAVDFANNRVHICNNVLYSADIGVYENLPKTKSSVRWVALPEATMDLLRTWKLYQAEEVKKLGDHYTDRGYLFAQDNGKAMNPDSVTTWLDRFAKRHGLRHINPHAFRHSMASMLIFNRMDKVSISKRLGHSSIAVTEEIYGHLIEEADQQSADIIADVFLKKA